MLRKLVFILMTGIILGLPLASAHAFEMLHGPTELVYYDTVNAYNGVTGFSVVNGHRDSQGNGFFPFVLIDMYGRVIHTINSPYTTTGPSQLIADGNLLRCQKGDWLTSAQIAALDPNGLMNSPGYLLQEVDWNGNQQVGIQVWNTLNGYQYALHDSFEKIWNNQLQDWTYIAIVWEAHTAAEASALGGTSVNPNGWCPDAIYEFKRDGTVVWKWSFFDHFGAAANQLKLSLTQLTTDMLHCNSLDYNQSLDQIVFNSRNLNEFYVIDHGNTFVSTTNWASNIAAAAGSTGNFLYRFGNAVNYNQGTAQSYNTNGTEQFWGGSDVQWIKPTFYTDAGGPSPTGPSLPTGPSQAQSFTGDFLIFDNGSTNYNGLFSRSQIKEISPYISGAATSGSRTTGLIYCKYPTSSSYVNPPLAGYSPWNKDKNYGTETGSNQVRWKFKPKVTSDLNSPNLGSVQRLPNGNTFINSGWEGHFVEIYGWTNTSSGAQVQVTDTGGHIAWEYVNPLNWGYAMRYQHDQDYQSNGTDMTTNGFNVFSAKRYSVNDPALVNRVVLNPSTGFINPTVVSGSPELFTVGDTLTGRTPCVNQPCEPITTIPGGNRNPTGSNSGGVGF